MRVLRITESCRRRSVRLCNRAYRKLRLYRDRQSIGVLVTWQTHFDAFTPHHRLLREGSYASTYLTPYSVKTRTKEPTR